MSVKKFKFVSPGVLINEIDKSLLPDDSPRRGPLVIGRSERGPSMRPTQVRSFAEFVDLFGEPIPGGRGGDVWRDGNYTSTTYASYAAQAYLRNNSPLTFVRLLGSLHGDVSAGTGDETPGWRVPNHAVEAGGGAYGLFLFDSGSYATRVPGTLGAIWYVPDANTEIVLSGTLAKRGSTHATASAGALVKSHGASREFKAVIREGGTDLETIIFNFDRSSDKFIRKVFNTNPTLTNTSMIAAGSLKKYWLGESFEGFLDTADGGVLSAESGSAVGKTDGAIVILEDAGGGDEKGGLFKLDNAASRTGWIISQDTGNSGSFDAATAQKLFYFETLHAGEWDSKNLKISITDIKASTNEIEPFGSFTVLVRSIRDTDASPDIYERFEDCDLNPNSPNYIGRVIGDKFEQWSEKERRLREYGQYDNNSQFIRVVVAAEVEAGLDARLLPAGFHGPPAFNRFGISGSAPTAFGATSAGDGNAMIRGGTNIRGTGNSQLILGHTSDDADGHDSFLADVTFPTIRLRGTSDDPTLSDPTKAFFGLDARRSSTGRLFNEAYQDLVRPKPQGIDSYVSSSHAEPLVHFSLDDLSASSDFNNSSTSVKAVYNSGSRKAGTSITAAGITSTTLSYSANFDTLLDLGFNKFSMPLFGGFDGFDVTEREPLRNSKIITNPTDKTDHVFNTYKRAIDMVTDTDNLDLNLATIPGLTNATLTGRLIDNCEERGDALAIIDLENDYTAQYESITSTAEADRVHAVDDAVTSLKNRNINSSYGCAFYPWVLVRDTVSSGQTIWMPPSVVALGVMGNTETSGELWFAPAGFNRGGLSEGHAGVTVVGVRQKLSAKDRDKLYNQNINPIASFPAEGVVIFGQKTLQLTRSALDRINVRRLMIFLKKEISFAASRILFDQNVPATWARFISTVDPFLSDVQSRFGVTDYKLVLDETTTTPDLVDRNILYAKIFIKPARAIEYIALDFIITNTGASFEE